MLAKMRDGMANRAIVAVVSLMAGIMGTLLAKAQPAIHAAFCSGAF